MQKNVNNDERSSTEHVALVQRLFVTHTRSLLSYLMAFSPSASQADDLLQEVFLRVTDKAHTFRDGTNFLAWARAIARNLLFEAAREQRRAPWALSPEVIEKLEETAPELTPSDEQLSALKQCIAALKNRQRELIVLRYERELAPEAIAAETSLKIESVHVMLSRARAALRECVQRKLRVSEHRS